MYVYIYIYGCFFCVFSMYIYIMYQKRENVLSFSNFIHYICYMELIYIYKEIVNNYYTNDFNHRDPSKTILWHGAWWNPCINISIYYY